MKFSGFVVAASIFWIVCYGCSEPDKADIIIGSNISLDSNELDQLANLINRASRIELISIEPECYMDSIWNEEEDRMVIGKECHQSSIIKNFGEDSTFIDTARIGSKVKLSVEDISEILPILYSHRKVSVSAACYFPRHGICLYDHSKRIIGFIEICFECSELKKYGEFPNLGATVPEDVDKLEKILSKHMTEDMKKQN